MTFGRSMRFSRLVEGGQAIETDVVEFWMNVGGGWGLRAVFRSYAHLPLTAWIELRHKDDLRELSSVPAPRLAVMGGRRREILVEVIAVPDFPGPRGLVIRAIQNGNEEGVVPARELVATVGSGWEVRLILELAPSGLPRIRILGPAPRLEAGKSEGEALLGTHIPDSPFHADVHFQPCVITTAPS